RGTRASEGSWSGCGALGRRSRSRSFAPPALRMTGRARSERRKKGKRLRCKTALQAALERQVHHLHERVSVERPLAPVGIEIGEGLGGDGLVQGFPGRLELSYPVRGRGQHVAILREIGLGAKRAVAR